MPNRILKESICTSESIDGLTWFEECFFYRLIVNCDDYGRMDARIPILRSRLFPLKSLSDEQISSALKTLHNAGIVDLYSYDDHPYIQLHTWESHQSIRAKRSKYPSPDESELHEREIICKQMQADESKCPRNPIQSNPIQSESESEYESNTPPLSPKGEKTKKPKPDKLKAVVDAYTADEEIRTLLYDWLDVRKSKRATGTETAIQKNLEKLEGFAKESGLSVNDYLGEVIRRTWTAFFVVPDFGKPAKPSKPTQQQTDYSQDKDFFSIGDD